MRDPASRDRVKRALRMVRDYLPIFETTYMYVYIYVGASCCGQWPHGESKMSCWDGTPAPAAPTVPTVCDVFTVPRLPL